MEFYICSSKVNLFLPSVGNGISLDLNYFFFQKSKCWAIATQHMFYINFPQIGTLQISIHTTRNYRNVVGDNSEKVHSPCVAILLMANTNWKFSVTYLETSTKFGIFLEKHKKLLLLAVMNSETVVHAWNLSCIQKGEQATDFLYWISR